MAISPLSVRHLRDSRWELEGVVCYTMRRNLTQTLSFLLVIVTMKAEQGTCYIVPGASDPDTWRILQ